MTHTEHNWIALDFETYWGGDYSVKKMGNQLFCRDARFRATLVAAWNDTTQIAITPARFDWTLLHGARIIAHNAAFDRACFDRLQRDGTIPPDIIPASWHDSAGACAYFGIPRTLDGAVWALFNVKIDKGIRARSEYGQQDLFDDEPAYAVSDAKWAWMIWQRLGAKWPAEEQAILDETDRTGERGVCIDSAAANKAILTLNESILAIEAALPFSPPGSGPALKAACRFHNEPVPPGTAAKDLEVDAWCKKYQHKKSPLWVRQIQEWRTKNRTRRVVEAMLQRVNPATGRMQYQLKYFGAEQTGRWAGGGGLNMQNLNRKTVANTVNLRNLITPAPGNAMVIVDFSAIEAVVLLWLAGDYGFLKLIHDGMDVYEATARQMLGYDDPRPLKEVNPGLRTTAKPIRLGLQFNMKADTFQRQAMEDYGLDIPIYLCEKYVEDFRILNPKTVSLWDRLTNAFSSRSGCPVYGLPLPSGRVIHYWAPEAKQGGWKLSAQAVKDGPRYSYHAGTLAENFASGTSRDILARAWLRCRNAGFRSILSVHDELAFEVPEATAERDAQDITNLMVQKPDWPLIEYLPISVETKIVDRYQK